MITLFYRVHVLLCFTPFWSPIYLSQAKVTFFFQVWADLITLISNFFLIYPCYKIVGMWEGLDQKNSFSKNCLCFIMCGCTLSAFLTMHFFLIQSPFCAVFFHPIHMDAFYLPMKFFHNWRVVVRSKSPKTWNCQGYSK